MSPLLLGVAERHKADGNERCDLYFTGRLSTMFIIIIIIFNITREMRNTEDKLVGFSKLTHRMKRPSTGLQSYFCFLHRFAFFKLFKLHNDENLHRGHQFLRRSDTIHGNTALQQFSLLNI